MSVSKVEGKIHFIEDTKTYGQNGFRKRTVVLEQENGRFTSYLPMEFIQDSCDDVDQLAVGNDVEITYRLNGRKWQRDANSEVKYFLSAEATGFKVLNSDGTGSGGAATPNAFKDADVPYGETFESDENPPF